MSEHPRHLLLVDEDGLPRSVLDLARAQFDATRLMWNLAAASGDNAELDRICNEWADDHDPVEFGLIAGAALTLMARCIIEPLLQLLDELRPGNDTRAKLAESRDHAERTLGGGR
ncbi:hypothetical protein [Nocardia acidivorans]|uniref:hypothetical protein n=1 Tax=Nocardia acidivorans TaxID=404580 RepID=UPI000835B23A|nr:hypothetical protein [Nocardia acidivorans]